MFLNKANTQHDKLFDFKPIHVDTVDKLVRRSIYIKSYCSRSDIIEFITSLCTSTEQTHHNTYK